MSIPSPLTDSFFIIRPVIDNRFEWDLRVAQALGTLSSLSEIKARSKYHFDEKDSKFNKSTWWFGDSLKEWIGDWAAEYVAMGEEAVYRRLWSLSVHDAMEGLSHVNNQIIETLAIASRSLEPDVKNLAIDLPALEKDIQSIYNQFAGAYAGVHQLAHTYEPDIDRHSVLLPTVKEFCKGTNEFVLKVLDQIEKAKVGHFLSSSQILNLSPFLPAPFVNPRHEQRAFNENLEKNFYLMQGYVKRNLEMIMGMKNSGLINCIKGRSEKRPWTIAVTKAGRIYFHYHVSIVPRGEGGCFKKDKRAYSYTDGVDIAKLSTETCSRSEPRRYAVAQNEERFLKLFSQKKFPNIVETFDIFWIKNKLVIYQKYCVNISLETSLVRLKNEPEKKKKILVDILRGLSFLHAEGIVHRDLKPANIFLDREDGAHIGDFGFACYQTEVVQCRGTPQYTDPALFYATKATCASDIWSFGMLMYGLLTNSTAACPWPWQTACRVAKDIPEWTRLLINKTFPEPRKEDLWKHSCWETLKLNPADRPTAKQLLERLENSTVQQTTDHW